MNHPESKSAGRVFLALFLAVLYLAAITANAQGAPQGPSLEDMASALNLSDEQAAQVGPILEDARVRRESIFEAHSDKTGRERMKAMRPELEVVSEDVEAQLAGVLDDEQMATYLELKEERRQEARQRMFRRQR